MESLFPRTVIFKNVVPKSAASVLPENLLEMKFTGPIPELLSQDLWGEKPRNLCFNQPLQVILMHDQCENHLGTRRNKQIARAISEKCTHKNRSKLLILESSPAKCLVPPH